MAETAAVAPSSVGACSSPGCTNVAASRLACPKCIQLGMTPTYFCSQDCFKANYNSHKQIHALAKQIIAAGYVVVMCSFIHSGFFFQRTTGIHMVGELCSKISH